MTKMTSRLLKGLLCVLIATGSICAFAQRPPVSLEDLVGWVRIAHYRISPDGRHVAYVTTKGLPRENVYEVALNVIPTSGTGTTTILAQLRMTHDMAFEPDSGGIKTTTGQFAWSPDVTELIYTVWVGSQMEIRSRVLKSGADRSLLSGADHIVLGKSGESLEFTASFPDKDNSPAPPDDSLLIKDDYTFYGSPGNPKGKGRSVVQHWSYRWGSFTAAKTKQDPPVYLKMPPEWSMPPFLIRSEADTYRSTGSPVKSPDGTMMAMIETAQEPAPDRRRTTQILFAPAGVKDVPARVVVPAVRPRILAHTILGWSADSKHLYYVSIGPKSSSVNAVDKDGRITTIFSDEASLEVPRSVAVGSDMKTAVFVRNTNLVPHELVAIDLRTGKLTTLVRPNAAFEGKTAPVIRLIKNEIDADDFGRLYLPSDHQPGKKYPLVITHYYSYPGFVQVAGDEVPIQVLTAHGIAVLAMHSSGFNMGSTAGRFQPLVERVARPLEAMKWSIRKLTSEGIIDPDRVGVTGLSYGAEISMYAYWNSNAFRAVSVHGGSVSPTGNLASGPARLRAYQVRGLPPPSDPRWKELSAGLNARPDLPPLLVQSPETEVFNQVETWTRLRGAGAQVEWWHYPNEGHVKTGPAHKWWVYQRNLDWFRFWLKDEEDPNPDKAEQYARWRQMREKWELAKREQQKTVQGK